MNISRIVLATSLWVVAAASHAGLVGDSVNFLGCFPELGANCIVTSAATTVATADATDAFVYGLSTTDVNESEIVVTATDGYSPGTFNGIVVSDLDWVGEPDRYISGFALIDNTFGVFDASDVSFTDDSVTINLGRDSHAGTARIALQTSLRTAHVSEPSTLLPALAILLGVVGSRRRRQKPDPRSL